MNPWYEELVKECYNRHDEVCEDGAECRTRTTHVIGSYVVHDLRDLVTKLQRELPLTCRRDDDTMSVTENLETGNNEMTTYTAADFEAARFAEHPNGGLAARVDTQSVRPWSTSSGKPGFSRHLSDSRMASDGWTPAREAASMTAQEHLEALRTTATYAVPEGQMIPAGAEFVEVHDDGFTEGPYTWGVDAPRKEGHVERRTLDPLPARSRHRRRRPVAEVPDALIEKAALAADYADDPWPSGDPADWEQGPRADQYRATARAALSAVADDLRAEGWDECAVEGCNDGGMETYDWRGLVQRNPYRQETAR